MGHADVFIDPEFDSSVGPDPVQRVWRTVLVGGLRQGGSGYYALDVTQPDDIDETTANTTYGEMIGTKTNSPNCLDGGGSSCDAGATTARPYPSVLWEFSDPSPGAPCSDFGTGACSNLIAPALGETWSRPVLGRIKVIELDLAGHLRGPLRRDLRRRLRPESGRRRRPDRHHRRPRLLHGRRRDGQHPLQDLRGRRRGRQLRSASGRCPPPPAVADYNDDGYLDVVYIGDTRGNMWRIDITPDAAAAPIPRGELQADGQLHGYQPFQLFDTCRDVHAKLPEDAAQDRQELRPAHLLRARHRLPRRRGDSAGAGHRLRHGRPLLADAVEPDHHRPAAGVREEQLLLRHRRRLDGVDPGPHRPDRPHAGRPRRTPACPTTPPSAA